jgi:hypothetical protein
MDDLYGELRAARERELRQQGVDEREFKRRMSTFDSCIARIRQDDLG